MAVHAPAASKSCALLVTPSMVSHPASNRLHSRCSWLTLRTPLPQVKNYTIVNYPPAGNISALEDVVVGTEVGAGAHAVL